MSTFSGNDATFLGIVLEGICYGLYSVLFILFLTLQRRRRGKIIDGPPTLLTSVLYILCTLYISMDIAQTYFDILPDAPNIMGAWNLDIAESALYSIVDFLAQTILIYRCWIIYGKKYIVIAVPAILSLAALGGEFALVGILGSTNPADANSVFGALLPTGISAFSVSLGVNAIVTTLIVSRIWVISRQSETLLSKNDKTFHVVIAMLIESGLIIFFTQLIWVITFALQLPAFYLVGGPVIQIYGITPTILAVRVSLGASFDHRPRETTPEFGPDTMPSRGSRTYGSQTRGVNIIELSESGKASVGSLGKA